MNPAGSLKIRATWAAGEVTQIAVELQRPPLTRLFSGQNPAAVVRMLPHLYALCAEAQGACAQAALAAAQGREFLPLPRDNTLLWLEVLHENLWRLLLDWPAACGQVPEHAAFAAWRQQRFSPDNIAHTQDLIEHTLSPLAEKCLSHLVDRNTPNPETSLQPACWLRWWTAPESPKPAPPQITNIADAFRQRISQTHKALNALVQQTAFPLSAIGDGPHGVAQCLSARGILTHAITLDGEKVAKYHLEAPTDACFTSPVSLSTLLAGTHFDNRTQARQGLETAILALDPCLPHEVEWNDA